MKALNLQQSLFYLSFAFALVVMFFTPTGVFIDGLSILAGLIMLVVAGDKLVESAGDIGIKMGLNHLLIGIVIIGFGTSAPEVITVFIAGLQDATDLALGNIFGSNIANIGLILGVGLLMLKSTIHTDNKWKEYISLVIATLFTVAVVFFYGKVDLWVSIILLCGLAYYLHTTIKSNGVTKVVAEENIEETLPSEKTSWMADITGIIIGLVGLMIGAKILVDGSVNIATALGVPEKIIGLTIIAVGTSLPELASAFAAAKKGYGDMIFGNVLGSNVFNLLAASSAGGLVAILPTSNVKVDVVIMTIFTLALLLMMFKKVPFKTFGLMLLLGYTAFLVFTGFSI